MDPLVPGYCLDLIDGNESAPTNLISRLAITNTSLSLELAKLFSGSWDSIQIVTRVVPASACWWLACDFAAHILPIWEEFHPEDKRPHHLIQVRRQSLQRGSSFDEVRIANSIGAKLLKEVIGDILDLCIVGSVVSCVSLRREPSDAAWSAALHARSAVAWRELGLTHRKGDFSTCRAAEQRWQVEHLREFLLIPRPEKVSGTDDFSP